MADRNQKRSVMKRIFPGTFLAVLLLSGVAAAAEIEPEQRELFAIYKELVEINTTDSVGDNTQAARAMAARLVAAGFPQEDVRVLVHPGNAKKGNLVARLRGTGKQKPVLLLAHLDVVEAHKEDWSPDLDPFRLIERDGYYYGRGTSDDKAMAAIFVANLIRYRQEGFKPRRDIVLALTADEEGGVLVLRLGSSTGWSVALPDTPAPPVSAKSRAFMSLYNLRSPWPSINR
jgi:acetylornithine deacetylase/succinyl-diaminopimelate desuccinylase-like protein